MLAVRPLKSSGDESEFGGDQFLDFSDGNLLDCIDLEELFAGMADDGVLPGLEMFDPEIMAEFAVSGSSGGEESDANAMPSLEEKTDDVDSKELSSETDSTGVKVVGSEESDGGGRKSSAQSKKKLKKNHQGDKRKLKVDWTPELHRRFVQAVEQLGLDKAVPSKILEIMAVDGLTRHNIASHLQKYRSQRKHVLAREAEAASWSQRRQMYGSAVAGKRVLAGPWLSGPPTMGFPPMAPPPPPPPMHHQFPRPLHVWGHPSMDRQWPKHMAHSPSPPPMGPPLWPVPPPCLPPSNPSSYWQPQPHHPQVATSVTHGTPCYPPPPPTVYNDELSKGLLTNRSGPQLQSFDFHPSKESVDAVIEDALTKPWQPLPLGLRAPSVDSVLSELHRQGIPKVPPTSPA